ncbi:MAG: homoserine kinase, partial [Mesorhizobium sp.]
EVGKALAELHLAGRDFALRRPNALAIDGWRKLWDASRDRADEVEPGLAAEVDADFADFERNWPKDLPEGIDDL